jgi:hypothetical protein
MARFIPDEPDKASGARFIPDDEAGPQEGPGLLGAAKKGLLESPLLAPQFGGQAPERKEGFEFPRWADPQQDLATRFEPYRTGAEDVPAPQTLAENVAYQLGASAPATVMAAAAAPVLAPALHPAVAVLAELGATTAGITASEKLREEGASAPVQIAGDIAASIIAPGAVVGGGTRLARRAGLGVIDEAAERAAGRLARAGPETIEASKELARRIDAENLVPTGATQRSVDPADVYEAALHERSLLARGVRDPEKYVERARGRVAQAIEDFQPPPGEAPVYPSPGQVLADEGGFNLQARERRLVKADPEYASDALGRRLDVIEDVSEEFAQGVPVGSYEAARESLSEVVEENLASVRSAWEEAPMARKPVVPTAPLKARAQQIKDAAVTKRYLPPEIDAILELPDEVSVEQLQNLSSELKMSQRAPRTAYTDWRRGRRAGELIDPTEEALEGALSGAEMESLRAAREGTRDFWKEFDPSRPAYRALTEKADPKDLMSAIRRAPDSVAEAAAVRSWISRNPEGQAGVAEEIFREIFGEDIGDKTVRQIGRKLRNRRDRAIYEILLTPEQLDFADHVARKWGPATQGITGTANQASATGTGYGELFDDARRVATQGGSLTDRLIEAASRAQRRATGATPQQIALGARASQDLELYQALLEIPMPDRDPGLRRIYTRMLEGLERRIRATSRAGTAAQRGVIREATQEDIERLRASE